MAYILPSCESREEVNQVIRDTEDKVVVLRFGRATDGVCMQLDETLAKVSHDLSRMAVIRLVEVDAVPEYIKYFDITLIPAVIFFFNATHMKVDFGTQDHTKWIGAFKSKQDFIDVVEVVYRGAMNGKHIVNSPLDQSRVPKYQLIYKNI